MLYFKYIKILIKSQMQYRSSFWMIVVAQLFSPFLHFVGLMILFEKFKLLKGWNFYEVILCFSVINIVYVLTEVFVRGFDLFYKNIVSGDFDRILLRPRNEKFQILCSEIAITKFGKIIHGVVLLIWSINKLSIEINFVTLFIFLSMIFGGLCIFGGIFVIGGALSFWTIQGLEATNILTHGGYELARYPMNIYSKWFSRIFTFIIPFGTVNYLPLMYILGKVEKNNLLYVFSSFYGVVFLIPCIFIWNIGLKRYKSTGS